MGKILICIIVFLNFCFTEIVKYEDVKSMIIKECRKYPSPRITQELIHAIMYWESRVFTNVKEVYNTDAKSIDNCIGLMQIKANTLDYFNYRKKIFVNKNWTNWTMEDMKDPAKNIHVGIFCLSNKLKQSNYNLWDALKLYSGGAKNYSSKVIKKMIEFYKE